MSSACAAGRRSLPRDSGSRLRDAINERYDWVTNVTDTYYLLLRARPPSAPGWFAVSIRDRQRSQEQMHELMGYSPHAIVACVGGGSTRWAS
jgi:tryptophan synthase beta subunit